MRRFAMFFLLLLSVLCVGCPDISGSGGADGPTHAVTEDACFYVFKGDQWGKNPKLSTYVANQCSQGPMYGEGGENVAVLEKGTQVQDRGAMPVTVNTASGIKQTTVRYVVIMSGPQKDVKGWIADDYLSRMGN
ncbi:MAG: hypothetical protein ACYS8W_05740 [Planctomycetota bacterium]